MAPAIGDPPLSLVGLPAKRSLRPQPANIIKLPMERMTRPVEIARIEPEYPPAHDNAPSIFG